MDTSEVWIKLLVNEEKIQISEVFADKPDGGHSVETDMKLNVKNNVWEKVIDFQLFQKELMLKGEKYLSELRAMNSETNEYIRSLEKNLEKIK